MFQYADRHYRCERYDVIGSPLKITGAFTGMNEGVVLRSPYSPRESTREIVFVRWRLRTFRIRPPRMEHHHVFLAPLQRIRFSSAIRRQSPLSDVMKGRSMLS
jgi:hypothetical protein